MEEKETELAFKWIVGLLQRHSVPFQIGGGFAARLYGSERELHDIDIGIPDNRFEELFPDIQEFVTYGPDRYSDEQWDLKLMSLKYRGQEIDLAGRDTIKFFDEERREWVPGYRELSNSEMKEAFGISVPIIPKEALVAYKRKLGRDVDLADVAAIEH